jgi:serine/threonine-protein kinase
MNVRVSMDGAALVERLDGGSIAVNPGAHTFTFETAAGARGDKQVIVSEGEKNKRVIVQLSKGPGATPASPTPNAPSAAPVTSSAPLTPSASSASPGADQSSSVPWKPIGIGVGAAGIVGLAIGAGFGIDASSKKSGAGCDSNSYCPSAQAASTLRAAKSSADLSTAFFVVGGLLAAGGVTLWVLAPSSPVQASASAGDHLFAIDVKGTW